MSLPLDGKGLALVTVLDTWYWLYPMVAAAPRNAASEATAKTLRPRDIVLLLVVDDDDKDDWSFPDEATGRGVECFVIGNGVCERGVVV